MKTNLMLAAVGACAIALSSAAPAQQSAPAPAAKGPSMDMAVLAAQTAVKACAANGYKVSAAVLDSGGVLKALVAADGAFPMAVASSQRKAATVLAFKAPSADIEARAKGDAAFAKTVADNPALFARAGGQPIQAGGEVIGAIGIGGAPGGEKDDVCALAAIKAIQG